MHLSSGTGIYLMSDLITQQAFGLLDRYIGPSAILAHHMHHPTIGNGNDKIPRDYSVFHLFYPIFIMLLIAK